MKGSRVLRAAFVPLLAMLALAPAAVAGQANRAVQPPEQGVWEGSTADGGFVQFIVAKQQDGSFIVTDQEYLITLTCSASGDQFPVDFSFFGFHQKVRSDGTFRLRLFDPFERLLLQGKLNGPKGAGVALGAFPQFSQDGGLEVCGSGEVAWNASAPPSTRATAPSSVLQVKVTRDSSGQVTVTRSQG